MYILSTISPLHPVYFDQGMQSSLSTGRGTRVTSILVDIALRYQS